MSRAKDWVVSGVAGLAAVLLCLLPSAAFGQVTLPDSGVDVGEYITAIITALGGIVAVAVGGYAAFLLVRAGLRWMGVVKS